MRLSRGYVLISLTVVVLLLAGLLWYAHVRSEAEAQRALQQAAQKFLEEHKDGRFPAPPTASEIWSSQEKRASAGDASAGQSPRAQPPATASGIDPTQGQPARTAQGPHTSLAASRTGFLDRHGVPLLTSALLLTALGFGGNTYRLARQRGQMRLECNRLAHELENARLRSAAGQGRPAPPWQEAALMMVRSSTVPAVAYDLDARVLEVSEAFTDITGYTRVDVPDVKDWFTKLLRTPDSELDGALESFRTNVRGGEIETRTIWTSRGEARTWLCQPLEVWPLEGDALLLVARATDVTAQAEEARASRAEAEALGLALREATQAPDAAAQAPSDSAKEVQRLRELAERAEEVRALNDRVRALNDRLATKEAETAALRDRLASKETEATALNDRLTSKETEAAALNDRLASKEAEIAALRAQETELARRADAQAADAARIASLQENADRFQFFAEHFEDSLWLADPRAPALVYATPQAAKLRGRPLAAMREDFSQWTAAIHAEDRERVQQAFSAAAVEGNYNVEYRVVREDGSLAWLHDRGVAVYDARKRLRHVAGITADVTVRKNAEDTTRRALAVLRTIVEHAPAMMWLKDAQGRYLYANLEYAKVAGFSADQLRGKTDFEVFPRALAERIHENDVRALAASSPEQLEETFQLAGGLRHFVALRFAARDPEMALGTLCGIAVDISERRRSEDATRAEDSRYRAIAATLPEALLIARENRVLYANAAAARLLGAADGSALVGTPLPQLAARADAGMVEAAKALTAQETGRGRFAARLKAHDGRELEVEVSAAAYETPTERAVQFIVQDVGERNARTQALKEAEAFFHSLCDAAPVAIRLIDTEGRATFTSRRWESMAGAGPAGDWLSQVHADDQSRVRSSYAAPARRDEPGCVEYRLREGAGRERWVLDTLLARYDAEGQWRGWLSAALDISERKRIEEALRVQREEIAALLDQCPAPVWTADATGSGYANQACLAWLGAKPDESRALDLTRYVHPDDREGWRRARERQLLDRARFDGEVRLQRSDGEFRHVHFAAVPVGTAGASAKCLVGFLEDVTACRESAHALALAEQRRAEVIAVLGEARGNGLAHVRHTAELVRLMFPQEPNLQKIATTVLTQAQQLETLVEAMLEPLRG